MMMDGLFRDVGSLLQKRDPTSMPEIMVLISLSNRFEVEQRESPKGRSQKQRKKFTQIKKIVT